MRHRTDIISRLPERALFIRHDISHGRLTFIAEVDGRAVAVAPTREAAMQTLLRRLALETIH